MKQSGAKRRTTEGFDPHASRIDPADPRLKVPRKRGRSIRKGPVAGIAGAMAGLLLLAISLALQPRDRGTTEEREQVADVAGSFRVPEMIRNAPDYDDPLELADARSERVVEESDTRPVDVVERPVPGFSRSAGLNAGAADDRTEKELEMALVASPFFGGGPDAGLSFTGGRGERSGAGVAGFDLESLAEASKMPGGLFDPPDPNGQEQKNMFMAGEGGAHREVKAGMLELPESPYEIKAGTVIPVSLITGINSDLPGEIIGQVRENVYDTVTGNFLLIPQGSRLIARYDSMVSYGQRRVLVCWNRLIRPDGSSLELGCAPGVDLAGYGGFEDEVDNHYDRLIGGVLLSSVLSVGATTSRGEWNGYDEMNTGQMFAANAGEELHRAGERITRKNLEVQPTITVRPGYSVNVLVNRDLRLLPVQVARG
ncbi:TrbI/VirB10 family protein [Prosthecochloris sp. HL-130-GSB]|jgi:type IV secretion system protein TrbI|uniref:TrbI/VirB10 family protein n=1 Tax=Prosthecochloris sp. HL-130-GSB TaxID=1974213 RepID=UPI000A1C0ED9|nr:TrbI/VirB10 family protein [Prosthecochloris sp. HL-130-GSB]ARM30499.1 conjugal transfer protein TrbI [Prosthecochloris sp. HL-130-GSB]